MNELRNVLDDGYNPAAIRARVGHLPSDAQREIEQISRILRAAFGYGEADMPARGRIVRIALTGLCADLVAKGGAITNYDFHINVNLPECADEAHWRFARRLVAAEIGAARLLTLTVEVSSDSDGIILYDAERDFPLNARELSVRP